MFPKVVLVYYYSQIGGQLVIEIQKQYRKLTLKLRSSKTTVPSASKIPTESRIKTRGISNLVLINR